ncbi:unnamed protein product [Fraxinus pennsylvanica]|uniref:Uncharacterized protein n=1 Tax=Fraxinus pennsylvanica TaxID=56036 RepID=A0AAD1ZIN3_9LAMI|nr:unnamed protein product [Fraxinus pennsylvanica]
MENLPSAGTDSTVNATFRLNINHANAITITDPKHAIGNSVVLEPFNLPGMVAMHQGVNKMSYATFSSQSDFSTFCLIHGLDKKSGSVSLESEDQKGCFIYSGVHYESGTGIELGCNPESSDWRFKSAASFKLMKGFSKYHPISFVAKGPKRNFLLAPLLSLRDESYTVYLNFQA